MNLLLEEIQKRLLETVYPQNYYYDVNTLEPLGLLKLRIDVFLKEVPMLFSSFDSFLDIGSSIGYFLFYHSLKSKYVMGIEKNIDAVDLCNQIKNIRNCNNLEIKNCSFSEFTSDVKYDMIFAGNCFHYLYKDEGWSVFNKIDALSSRYVVLELPLESSYLIQLGAWEDNSFTKDYTECRFIEEAEKYFTIEKITKSGTFGDRKVVVLRK